MSTTEEYKNSGYLNYGELVERISVGSHTGESFVRNRMAGPLARFRLLLIEREMIVLPSDRTLQGMYEQQLVYFFAAYLAWHKPFVRKSSFDVDGFFRAFFAQENWAVAFVPAGLKKEYRKSNQAVHSIGEVALRLVTA